MSYKSKYSVKEFIDLLKDSGFEVDERIFKNETDELMDQLLTYEKKYLLNSKDVKDGCFIINIPKNDKEEWIEMYDEYIKYFGDMSRVNSIRMNK